MTLQELQTLLFNEELNWVDVLWIPVFIAAFFAAARMRSLKGYKKMRK